MKRNRNIGGVDRISELPEGIIHGIMSHLSSKQVAQTCVLSKKWYRFKRNYPVLDFTLPRTNVKENSDYLSKIRQSVYDSLKHFSSNKLALQTFSLKNVFLGRPNLPNDLERWIKLAVANGVKELNLYAEVRDLYVVELDQPFSHLYTLPLSVSSSQKLTILVLTSCYLDLPISMFSSLRKLNLSECVLKGSITLKDTECPVLEEIRVQKCIGEEFKSIYISSLLRLHTVVIDTLIPTIDFINVEILSQSIQSLAVISECRQPWSDVNIQGCNRLKSLYLESDTITDAELNSVLLNAPLLEELYLFDCCNVKKMKISSPRLKTLEIACEYNDYYCDLIEVSVPKLENFIYKCCRPKTSPCIAIRIELADCCRCLKTLVLYNYLLADDVFHNLISRFPVLEKIWIIRCNLLRRIKIPNLQLKKLHIVGCSRLKAVEISSPNLSEVCVTGPKVPGFSISDDVYASGLRGKGVVQSYSKDSLLRLKEMLKSFVHVVEGGCIFDRIVNVGNLLFEE